MNNTFILQRFREASRILYVILGPNNSTKLSQSGFGKAVFSTILGNPKKDATYTGIDGIKLKLSKEEALNSGFIHLGVINPYETKLMKKLLRPGDIFFDIGAYVDGWHSIIAARIVSGGGKVYTFEPVPEYYKKLSDNIRINKLKNVVVEKLAISDTNGKQTFYIGGLASTLYKNHLKNDVSGHVTVSTMSLDTYVKKHNVKKIALVKIDAEGAEMDVINGAKTLLGKKDAPDLIVEVSDVYLQHGNTTESTLLDTLKKMGYKAYSITENGLGKYVRKSNGRELMNVFFSKKSSKFLPVFS